MWKFRVQVECFICTLWSECSWIFENYHTLKNKKNPHKQRPGKMRQERTRQGGIQTGSCSLFVFLYVSLALWVHRKFQILQQPLDAKYCHQVLLIFFFFFFFWGGGFLIKRDIRLVVYFSLACCFEDSWKQLIFYIYICIQMGFYFCCNKCRHLSIERPHFY